MRDHNASTDVANVVDSKYKKSECFKDREQGSNKTKYSVIKFIEFDAAQSHESAMARPEKVTLSTI